MSAKFKTLPAKLRGRSEVSSQEGRVRGSGFSRGAARVPERPGSFAAEDGEDEERRGSREAGSAADPAAPWVSAPTPRSGVTIAPGSPSRKPRQTIRAPISRAKL